MTPDNERPLLCLPTQSPDASSPPLRVPRPPTKTLELLDIPQHMILNSYRDWAGEWIDLQLPEVTAAPRNYVRLHYEVMVYEFLSLRPCFVQKYQQKTQLETTFACCNPGCSFQVSIHVTKLNGRVNAATAMVGTLRPHTCCTMQSWTSAYKPYLECSRQGDRDFWMEITLIAAYLLQRPSLILLEHPERLRQAVASELGIWISADNTWIWVLEAVKDLCAKHPLGASFFHIWKLDKSSRETFKEVSEEHGRLSIWIITCRWIYAIFVLPVEFLLLCETFALAGREKTYRLFEREGVQVVGRILECRAHWSLLFMTATVAYRYHQPATDDTVVHMLGDSHLPVRTKTFRISGSQHVGVGDDVVLLVHPCSPSEMYLAQAVRRHALWVYKEEAVLLLVGLGLIVAFLHLTIVFRLCFVYEGTKWFFLLLALRLFAFVALRLLVSKAQ